MQQHRCRNILVQACVWALMLAAPAVWAGTQHEELLADSVRTALSASITNSGPPQPEFDDIESRIAYLRWLGQMGDKLKNRKADFQARREFLETVWYESKRAGLDPSLVLGLVEVESGFRKFAISPKGARGYMQVMPFWTRQLADGNPNHLFHMQTNLRFGCVILKHYLAVEKGNLFMALGRYNGSRGRPDYPSAVFAAQRKYVQPSTGGNMRMAANIKGVR